MLDLCCGTGDIALMFRWRRGDAQGYSLTRCTSELLGADFTEEMLRVATGAPGHIEKSLVECAADALRLPFADNSFDVVSVGYGLRNLADIEAGFARSLARAAAGRKIACHWISASRRTRLLRSMYFGYLRTVLPVSGPNVLWRSGHARLHSRVVAGVIRRSVGLRK